MAPIIEIARRHGIAVVEDAAHAFPASYRGETVGSLGDAAAFSFYATKTLAAGEGGMLATDNHAVARRARIMRLHGITHGGPASNTTCRSCRRPSGWFSSAAEKSC